VKIHARYIAQGLLALWTTALPVGAGSFVDLDLTKHVVGVQPKDGIPALTKTLAELAANSGDESRICQSITARWQ
tara:strand:- start:187 stop:411 length:225 start_codon:yes stop_codon:yes gene_type:complete